MSICIDPVFATVPSQATGDFIAIEPTSVMIRAHGGSSLVLRSIAGDQVVVGSADHLDCGQLSDLVTEAVANEIYECYVGSASAILRTGDVQADRLGQMSAYAREYLSGWPAAATQRIASRMERHQG
jgi:hypothetical protein